MSFDFSDLVLPDDGNDNYDYLQFLADPIYDSLRLIKPLSNGEV